MYTIRAQFAAVAMAAFTAMAGPAHAAVPTASSGPLLAGNDGFVAGSWSMSRSDNGDVVTVSAAVTTAGGVKAATLCVSLTPFTSRVGDFDRDARCLAHGPATGAASSVALSAALPAGFRDSDVYVQFRVRVQDHDGVYRNGYAGWQAPDPRRGTDQWGVILLGHSPRTPTTTPTTTPGTTTTTAPGTTTSTLLVLGNEVEKHPGSPLGRTGIDVLPMVAVGLTVIALGALVLRARRPLLKR